MNQRTRLPSALPQHCLGGLRAPCNAAAPFHLSLLPLPAALKACRSCPCGAGTLQCRSCRGWCHPAPACPASHITASCRPSCPARSAVPGTCCPSNTEALRNASSSTSSGGRFENLNCCLTFFCVSFLTPSIPWNSAELREKSPESQLLHLDFHMEKI